MVTFAWPVGLKNLGPRVFSGLGSRPSSFGAAVVFSRPRSASTEPEWLPIGKMTRASGSPV
jgi:hypothetical protein